jgi:hypothetical protein
MRFAREPEDYMDTKFKSSALAPIYCVDEVVVVVAAIDQVQRPIVHRLHPELDRKVRVLGNLG